MLEHTVFKCPSGQEGTTGRYSSGRDDGLISVFDGTGRDRNRYGIGRAHHWAIARPQRRDSSGGGGHGEDHPQLLWMNAC